MQKLNAIIVSAPAAMCEQLNRLSARRCCSGTWPPCAYGLLAFNQEIKAHNACLEPLMQQLAPELLQERGMGVGTAAVMLLLVGDNPERIRSKAALAKLWGACPIPMSNGRTSLRIPVHRER